MGSSLIYNRIYKTIIIKSIIALMFRPRNNTKPSCDRHHFSLKPRNQYVIRPQNLNISFCKELCGQVHKSKHVKRANSCLNCPTFNKDNNYASPAFVLRSQKRYYQQRKNEIQNDHDKKYLEHTDQKSSLKVPRPKSRNNYCSVCHINYEDYLQHIQNPFHLGKVKKSGFNRHIHELAESFKEKINKGTTVSTQRKQVLMEINDSEDVQIIQNPQKKIKEDCNNTPFTTHPAQTPNPYSFYPQTPLDFARQLAEYYQHQLTVTNYWSFFNNTFPIYPQAHSHLNNFMTMQTIPYPLFTLTQMNKVQQINSTQNLVPCIVIDD